MGMYLLQIEILLKHLPIHIVNNLRQVEIIILYANKQLCKIFLLLFSESLWLQECDSSEDNKEIFIKLI